MLRGPQFGSYRSDEVGWLLTDLSELDLEADVGHREAAIQAGLAHYAESLPIEYQPDPDYQQLFDEVLSETAGRLAHAVGAVTELVLAERGRQVVLASLARAGTPIGILMRRWARHVHGLEIPHYAVSIVRGRGIDRLALTYLAAHHDPSSVVFVDGWTGKGAIAKELTAALGGVAGAGGPRFSDDLAVLADPGHSVRTFGTRDDFLIASACLNSTVSGLVSRTVLNPAYTGPDAIPRREVLCRARRHRRVERVAGQGVRTVRRGAAGGARRRAGAGRVGPRGHLRRVGGGGGDPSSGTASTR